MLFMRKTTALPSAAEALPGRATPIPTAVSHFVNGRQLQPPYPEGLEQAVFGLGCFWGAERKFWELGDGIYTTAVCYAGGHTANPTYEEVCSGRTGHTEAVLVVFDPRKISYDQLLKTFWEKMSSATGRRRFSGDRTPPAPLRYDRYGPNTPLHKWGWRYDRRRSTRPWYKFHRRVPRTCAPLPRNSRARTPPAPGLPDRAAAADGR